MIIRLILPICSKTKENNKKYCSDSIDIEQRLNVLQHAMDNSTNIDLVVTSNNFFEFHKPDTLQLNDLLNRLTSKKKLIIGIDYEKAENKFDGINSQVLYLLPDNNKYIKEEEIWETWSTDLQLDKGKYLKDTKNKVLKLFKEQNRMIKINKKDIILLSCGDILKYINFGNKGLPEADIYIDLAHLDFGNWNIKSKKSNNSNLQEWMQDTEKILLVTQQLTVNKLSNKHYFENNKYKLIYPENLFKNQKVYFFNNQHKIVNYNPDYIFIDIEV